METITVKGELLFVLNNKREWINRVPQILPQKTRGGEVWLWVDKHGNNFELGRDFDAAEKRDSYPCRVYRLCSVSAAVEMIEPS